MNLPCRPGSVVSRRSPSVLDRLARLAVREACDESRNRYHMRYHILNLVAVQGRDSTARGML